jgi:integrase
MTELIERRAALPAPLLLSDEVIGNLKRHAYFARGAMSPNTERARLLATGHFSAWCAEHGLQALPASVETVVAYVDDTAARYKPATIVARVSHVSWMHEAAKVANPCRAPEVMLAKKRMFREQGRRQKQMLGITEDLRGPMLAAAPDTLQGTRNRALLSLAYDTGLRRSEIVALLAEDVVPHPTEAGWGTVLVRKSKTDQEGEGAFKPLAPDTFRYVRAWLEAAGITAGPLFRRVTRWGTPGRDALAAGAVYDLFKDMAETAGLPAEVVAGIGAHSTRVGMAQDQAAAGLKLVEIMQSGGWKTAEMVARYTERLNVMQSGAAKLARMQGRA